jgi:hypothetical protein
MWPDKTAPAQIEIDERRARYTAIYSAHLSQPCTSVTRLFEVNRVEINEDKTFLSIHLII